MKSDQVNLEVLFKKAQEAQKNAYAVYSRFRVGAVIPINNHEYVCGCNVENASYSHTICAERSAIVAAIAWGHKNFHSMAIVSDAEEPVPPCGACRQVIIEHFPPSGKIYCFGKNFLKNHKVLELTVHDLLPHSFTNKFLMD